jgi:signal transduction histidine kinase
VTSPRERRIRLGLTVRLALVGLASALAPFAVGMALLLIMPDRIATKSVDSELQRAASLAGARLQSARSDLAFDLASIDQRRLADLALKHDDATIAALLEHHNDSPTTVVSIRPATSQLAPSDGAVAAAIQLRVGAHSDLLVARRPELEASVLESVARDTDVGLHLVAGDGARLAAANHDGRADRTVASADHARTQSQSLDRDRRLSVVASVDGTPLDLLIRSRGDELRMALLLLFGAGVLSAVSVALIMNRMLSSVAAVSERMSSGDFETRLPVVGVDAGARVAMSLNELAAKLQDRIGTLERTVERLDRTLASIDDGVVSWSQTGAVQTWNASAVLLLDMDVQAARGNRRDPVLDALRDEFHPGRRRVLLPVGDGARHLAVDLTVRRMRDGGILQVLRDATPALSIERARTNFLVTAAHELRTPLTSILGFAATLADESLQLTPEVRRVAMQQILEDSERLDSVVDMFFESSMLARDKVAVSLACVPIAAAVLEATEALPGGHSIELIGIDAALAVRADRTALTRIITELLDNAVKYGEAPIRVSAEIQGARARIHVSDAGRGIPVELQDAVFEPFFRLDPEMRSDVGGAGMGLYTARRLSETMGGLIAIKSNEADSDGMVVTVDLPAWTESSRPETRIESVNMRVS